MKSIKFSWVVLLMLAGATSVVFAQQTAQKKVEQAASADKGAQQQADNKGGQSQPAPATTGSGSSSLSALPERLDFPSQQLTGECTQTVIVKNITEGDVVIRKAVGSGDFVVVAPAILPQTLPKGGSTLIAVRFTPKQAGNASGLLQIQPDKGDVLDVPLTGVSYQPLGGICSYSHGEEITLILLASLVYWLAMVIVRWNRIAHPAREFLRGQIATLRTELEMLPENLADGPGAGAQQRVGDWRQEIEGVIEDASREISPKAAGKGPADRLANFLFWSRGQEIAGWGYVHDAETKMAAYQPIQTVMARLEAAEQRLRGTNDAACLASANIIHQALTASTPTDPSRLRALLAQALTILNDRADTSFADLVSWQNKASWLVGNGLFVFLILTIAIPNHSVLLIVGATGGVISRMSRSLNRKDVPTDYGASWTTLFLSPVSGALGAWAGILISDLAAKLNVLGPLFQADFTDPCRPSTLAIAFVFGFSERLLDGVLDKLEEKAAATTTQTPQPAQNTVPSNTPTGLTIKTQKLDAGKVNQSYAAQLQASGAVGDVTWSLKEGALPDGLQLTASGAQAGSITGTPSVAKSFTFTVSATDGTSTKDQQLTIVINP